MTTDQNRTVAQDLLQAIGTGASPDAIARMFHDDVVFEVPGDDGALPWIGRKTGHAAVRAFILENRRLLEPRGFDVHDIVADRNRAGRSKPSSPSSSPFRTVVSRIS
jgi:uncharacterized protein